MSSAKHLTALILRPSVQVCSWALKPARLSRSASRPFTTQVQYSNHRSKSGPNRIGMWSNQSTSHTSNANIILTQSRTHLDQILTCRWYNNFASVVYSDWANFGEPKKQSHKETASGFSICVSWLQNYQNCIFQLPHLHRIGKVAGANLRSERRFPAEYHSNPNITTSSVHKK